MRWAARFFLVLAMALTNIGWQKSLAKIGTRPAGARILPASNVDTAGDGAMLTAEGCKARRLRLWERFDLPGVKEIVLADPAHVRYFANAYITPFSLGGDEMIALSIRRDGTTTLFHDNRAPDSLSTAFVDEHIKIPWYDGQRPAPYPRQLALQKMPTPPMDLPG